MEKGEPALVPQWLKASTGSTVGGGSTPHHLTSASQSGSSINGYDIARSSSFTERSSLHFHRGSSCNAGTMHDKDPLLKSRPYSSFSQNCRAYEYACDRDTPRSDWSREGGRDFKFREKDSALGDVWDRDHNFADILANNMPNNRPDKENLQQSQSMISSRRGEKSGNKVKWPASGLGGTKNSMMMGGGLASSIHKAAFGRDFPLLGSEDKHGQLNTGVTDFCRVPSPGLSTAAQSLPLGSVSVIGGDGWTSALVEVPLIIGSNSDMSLSIQQATVASAAAVQPSTLPGLNMAEALVQAPVRARSTPHLSVETRKLEELAIKQSRQLIPMTPSMTKNAALSPSDRAKPKTARPGSLVNSLHGPVRAEAPKASQGGMLLVLKPNREKNGTSVNRENLAPSNLAKVSISSCNISSPSGSVPSNSKSPKLAADRKSPTLLAGQISDDRKPSAQGQSRIEFFNSLRRKTANASAAQIECPISVSDSEKSGEQIPEIDYVDEMKDDPIAESERVHCGNGDVFGETVDILANGERGSDSYGVPTMVAPEEEEAAFLRSLGWEENAGEEALTEEEINAFYELMKRMPSASFRLKANHFRETL